MASSTASPKPSLTDGNASTSALRTRRRSSLRDGADQHDVVAQPQAESGHRGERRLAVGLVVLERVPADDRQHRAVGSPAAPAPRTACRSPCAARSRRRPGTGTGPRHRPRPAAQPAGPRVTGGNRSASTPFGTTSRLDAVLVAQDPPPVLADDQHDVRLEDRAALAVDERRRGEVVDVVHGADHRDRGARVAHPGGGAGRDAVLGVQRCRTRRRPRQPGGQRVDRGEDPLASRRPVRGAGPTGRDLDRPVEALARVAERDDVDRRRRMQRLGERQRVHDAAARLASSSVSSATAALTRVRRTRSGSRSAIAAAARAARAAVSVTTQPGVAQRCPLRRRTPAGPARCRARRRRPAARRRR